MKRLASDWERLLRAAAQAPGAPLVEMNTGLQNRVLAQWRASPVASELAAVTALWWRGALTACSLAVIALALAVYYAPADSTDPYAEAESMAFDAEALAIN